MKYAEARPYADPEKAARRLMEHAQAFEAVQDVMPHNDTAQSSATARTVFNIRFPL